MFSLLIDTSGPYSTVAVAQDAVVSGMSAILGRPAEKVHSQIKATLRATGIALSSLDSVTIVTGPGSWTGLNIGVTAAKTLAQVLRVDVLPISSLDALVAGRTWRYSRLCAVLSAGRGRVYRAWYDTDRGGTAQSGHHDAEVLTAEALEAELAQADGSALLIEYGKTVGSTLKYCSGIVQVLRLSPEAMIAAAAHALPLGPEEAITLTPAYMQASLAERDAKR